MNKLESFIYLHDLDADKVMNELQNNGVISDNCVDPKDVAGVDLDAAIDLLTSLKKTK